MSVAPPDENVAEVRRLDHIRVCWANMKQRCQNPSHKYFRHYGGRGIQVCERWQTFENFLADMGPTWKLGLTIDRYPDNNGNYEPRNCRWATAKQQMRNMRSNRCLKVGETILTFTEVAERLEMSGTSLRRLMAIDAMTDQDLERLL